MNWLTYKNGKWLNFMGFKYFSQKFLKFFMLSRNFLNLICSKEILFDLINHKLNSVVQLAQLALPYLAKTKGCVINVSSMASERTTANSAFYGSLKSALDVWTKARAKTFGDLGVRMNCLKFVLFAKNVCH